MPISDYATPFSIHNNSDIGVLVVHGFTGSPGSLKYLVDFLGSNGLDVECPLLAGHGTHWADMNRQAWPNWVSDAEKALSVLKQRCNKVFVAGLSMGGAISLHLASEYDDVKGIVLINHALFFNRDPRIALIPILKFFVSSKASDGSDIKDPTQPTMAYERIPIPAMHELMKLMKNVRRRLPGVKQPVLIFKSREDHVIPVRSAVYTDDHIGSENKELVWLDNSYHVATQDYDKDIINEKTLSFIRSLSGA